MSRRIRLDKLLSSMGHGSRAEIKRIVKAGRVAVDGRTEKDSGRVLDPEQEKVELDGQAVLFRDKIYLMLHKPPGVISATEDGRERTVIDLLAPEDRVLEPFPVGRLDKDTVGLLLLTNDGQLAHELLAPRKHVPKTYEALVRSAEPVGEREAELFRSGIELDDGYVTMPAELETLGCKEAGADDPGEETDGGALSSVRLTIREGKFHQVKRMFQAAGGRVVHLKRVSMGPLVLDDRLPIGTYRELTEAELASLQPDALKAYRENLR